MSTEQIWKQFSTQLLGFIRSKISDEEQARDLLQEVFIKIHKHSDQLAEESKLGSWLYQITRNSITDYYRKKKPQLVGIPDYLEEEQEDDTQEQFLRCLMPFVHELEPIYREALLQTTFGSQSQKTYAEREGLSYSAAKSRIQRARQQLKERFVTCCLSQTATNSSKSCGNC
jgi:RNA polymerase sigma-70 factor (ECF subfamily)